jgi:hypothetical protein
MRVLGAFEPVAALRQAPLVLGGVLDGMLEGYRPPLFGYPPRLLGSRPTIGLRPATRGSSLGSPARPLPYTAPGGAPRCRAVGH